MGPSGQDLGERRQVQRPWGRDQPDLLWEGREAGERVCKEAELMSRAGVVSCTQTKFIQETRRWQV